MSVLKYTIPEISAYNILSAAVETKDGYRFSFDATDPSKSYMIEETKQDDWRTENNGTELPVPEYPRYFGGRVPPEGSAFGMDAYTGMGQTAVDHENNGNGIF